VTTPTSTGTPAARRSREGAVRLGLAGLRFAAVRRRVPVAVFFLETVCFFLGLAGRFRVAAVFRLAGARLRGVGFAAARAAGFFFLAVRRGAFRPFGPFGRRAAMAR
jgi:hypothetical protein